MQNPTYLGDAVYAYYDGISIQLKLNHHEAPAVVYLEPQVVEALAQFVERLKEENLWPQ